VTLMTLSDETPVLRSQLLGYMVFPRDENLRSTLSLTALARGASFAKEAIALTSDEAGALSNGPGFAALGELTRKAAQQGGFIAGDTLIALLQMRASNIEPSLGRAQFLVSRAIRRQKRERDGRVPSSDRSLRNAWYEFKRVAHFWAAWQLSEAKMRECHLREDPQAFLSLAVALTDMATANLAQPLLDADTWLPAPSILPRSLSIPPLADHQIESLNKTYRHATRD
jgi:hypothetical protein